MKYLLTKITMQFSWGDDRNCGDIILGVQEWLIGGVEVFLRLLSKNLVLVGPCLSSKALKSPQNMSLNWSTPFTRMIWI